MATGKEHFDEYKRGIPVVCHLWLWSWVASWFFDLGFLPQITSSIMWNYILVARYIDSDLDQISLTHAEGRMMMEIPVLGVIFTLYWTFYAFLLNAIAIVTRTTRGWHGAHRTFWSHSYFGTLLRVVYLNLPLIPIIGWWNELFANFYPETFLIESGKIAIVLSGQVLALFYADSKHYRLDGIK